MQRKKFGHFEIKKFSVALKIWLKNESFVHSEIAKGEIWHNPEKFWFVLENMAQKWDFLITPDLPMIKFG